MVGLLEKVEKRCFQSVQKAGHTLFLISSGDRLSFGGSELQKMLGCKLAGDCPDLDLEAAANLNRLMESAMEEGWIQSSHDVSEGGLAVCLAEKLFGSGLGCRIDFAAKDELNWLFAEGGHRWVISTAEPEKVQAHFGGQAQQIGTVQSEPHLNLPGTTLEVIDAEEIWSGSIERLMAN
jgi:phosphoribosylformylglycinamidine synthase